MLARLQVLLGGVVICHIRFSTTADTMMVALIGVRFPPKELPDLDFRKEHTFFVRAYLGCLLMWLRIS